MGTLRRLAGAEAIEGATPEDDRLESFLEMQFFERLRGAGLPPPTLQVVRVIGDRRIIRVDCEYRDPDVSVFLDGREYHTQSREKILDDLEVRNQLEAQHVRVLEFTYRDVMDAFGEVAEQLRVARQGAFKDSDLDLHALPGLAVEDIDPVSRTVVARVNPAAWMKSEAVRVESLRSANRARLAGWKLRRRAASDQ
jgi:hypothetical protein